MRLQMFDSFLRTWPAYHPSMQILTSWTLSKMRYIHGKPDTWSPGYNSVLSVFFLDPSFNSSLQLHEIFHDVETLRDDVRAVKLLEGFKTSVIFIFDHVWFHEKGFREPNGLCALFILVVAMWLLQEFSWTQLEKRIQTKGLRRSNHIVTHSWILSIQELNDFWVFYSSVLLLLVSLLCFCVLLGSYP